MRQKLTPTISDQMQAMAGQPTRQQGIELRIVAMEMALRCQSTTPTPDDIIQAAKSIEAFLMGAVGEPA
jgi:hypothetical protein